MKDQLTLSFLYIGSTDDVQFFENEILKNQQALVIDSGTCISVGPKKGILERLRPAGPIIVLGALGVLFFLLGTNAWVVFFTGFYLGILLFGDLYDEGPIQRLVGRIFRTKRVFPPDEIIPARILRFYNCHNQVLWTANRIFNNTQGRVVVIAGDVIPDNHATLSDVLLKKLQGVPSITILVTNLTAPMEEKSKFELGFDFVFETNQLREIPEFAKRQFHLMGRNRVSSMGLVNGLLLAIFGSIMLSLCGVFGKNLGAIFWGYCEEIVEIVRQYISLV